MTADRRNEVTSNARIKQAEYKLPSEFFKVKNCGLIVNREMTGGGRFYFIALNLTASVSTPSFFIFCSAASSICFFNSDRVSSNATCVSII